MFKSNAERQAKWRDKNRALFNLRRRNARKKGGDDISVPIHQTTTSGGTFNAEPTVRSSGAAGIPQEHPTNTRRAILDDLRGQIANVSKEPAVEHAPTKPSVYRNDYGNVITERQWNLLQKKKEEAKAGGYVIDEYSQ